MDADDIVPHEAEVKEHAERNSPRPARIPFSSRCASSGLLITPAELVPRPKARVIVLLAVPKYWPGFTSDEAVCGCPVERALRPGRSYSCRDSMRGGGAPEDP